MVTTDASAYARVSVSSGYSRGVGYTYSVASMVGVMLSVCTYRYTSANRYTITMARNPGGGHSSTILGDSDGDGSNSYTYPRGNPGDPMGTT
jgi:hypothetical protein